MIRFLIIVGLVTFFCTVLVGLAVAGGYWLGRIVLRRILGVPL